MSDLEARIEMLERIVIAMCSGQHFTVSLDKDGRPQFVETPRHHAHGGPPFSDVFMPIKSPHGTKEDGT